MRLIDMDKLKFPNIAIFDMKLHGVTVPMVRLIDLQMLMPTVDAAPVVHGKWTTKRTQKHDGEWYCTICDYEPIVMTDDMKYCPGCGAKMDLEENNGTDNP